MNASLAVVVGLMVSSPVVAESLVEGWVRQSSGEPVEAAQIWVFDWTDLQRGAVAQATTDATGYFALPLALLGSSVLPQAWTLGQNYPNPFNPSTIIPYQLAAAAPVRLEVFNLLGQRIAMLVDGERPAGFHTATWHATDAAGRAVGAGVYIYRMTVSAERQTGRMVLLDGQAGVSAGGTASVWSGASGGSRSDGEQVYGLIVSGEGLAPYVDSSFRVEAGMAPVELVVQAGQHLAGKATDDDCAFCDLFDVLNDDDEGPSPSGKAQTTLEVPAVPTNLRFEAVTDSSCRVRWDAAEGATDYDVNYKRAVGGKWTNEPHKGVRLYNTIYDLEPNTEYRWAARAENSDGTSEWVFGPNFTTVGADGQVTIPDANLRAAIAEALGKARGATITVAEMKTLAGLDADYSGIRDLTGLEFATNLTELSLFGNDISDISALRGLTHLTELSLGLNDISDISALRGLTKLTDLWLSNNDISDISALSGLTNLTDLSLGLNDISDVSALRGLTKLKWLFLGFSDISDISALSGLPNLTYLWLRNNDISDISALRGLTKLKWLSLIANDISDISALRGLTKLKWLSLGLNDISDISALSGLPNLTELSLGNNDISDVSALRGLTKLTDLWLSNNDISDISALSGLPNLTDLSLGNNDISDISALRGLTHLTELSLGYNSISDISALSGLPNLTYLWLRNNDISDISALSGLPNLTELNLRQNPLSASSINDHIPALRRSGATVRFDPLLRESDFDIELVFLDDHFDEENKNEIQYAARRWMSIIREDLPDFTFTDGWSGSCGDRSYAIPSGERIDDLRIYVVSFNGDDAGAPAGWAGPDVLRETSHLSVVGCMGFNLVYNVSPSTALHEIGHVLGIGTQPWSKNGFVRDSSNDPHFNGPRAIAAFNDAGGRNYTGKKVPLEENGGHWRESVLSGELMEPSSGSGWEGVVSAITIQALADVGYGVDVTQADPYTLPSAAAKVVATGSTPDDHLPGRLAPQWTCGVDTEHKPIHMVDPQGRIVRTLHR